MSSIGSPSPFFLAGKKAYQVARSLRFNDNDSAYLNRTPSSTGTRTKWTWSGWIKRSNLGSSGYQTFYAAKNPSNNTYDYIAFDMSTQKLEFGSGGSVYRKTQQVFRDVSAWYHLVVNTDTTLSTAADRIKIYLNGIEITSFSTSNNPSQNAEWYTNSQSIHILGSGYPSGSYGQFFDGYMTEVNFIDGQQYDASYFGETDATKGQWNPKKYTGSYGTNGFYLNFSDNSGTTATTLGKDSSGNGNNFTPNNFSVAANLGNDSMPDTPTNNFCTLNPLNATSSFNFGIGEGNLVFDQSSNDQAITGTFFITSGKWYWEIYKNSGQNPELGIAPQFTFSAQSNGSGLTTGVAFITNGGNLRNGNNGTASITGGSAQTGAGWIRIAVDMDNKKIWFSDTSGNYFNSGNPATGANAAFDFSSVEVANGWTPYIFMGTGSGHNCYVNFGQLELNSFSSNIPAGFKTLNSANLPDPTILLPNKHFGTLLYTGNGAASGHQIPGLNFQPDWVWIKNRGETYDHMLFDAIRGVGKYLESNDTTAEATGTHLESFDSDGFTVGQGNLSNRTNANNKSYVGWSWNAGDTDGKTYTVKVVSDSGNKYRFDNFGTSAVTLDLAEGGTYIFNMDDSSNASHPFMIGTTANDNTTAFGSGIVYKLDGVVKTFAQYHAGFAAATTRRLEFTIPASTNNLFYFCYAHSGMGGAINTNSTLGSSNFDGTTQTTVKVNQTAGFSIVTYTGNSTDGSTIGHGLGVTPNHVIWKNRTSGSSQWINWQTQLGDNFLLLNLTNAQAGASGNGLFTYGDFNSTTLKLKTATQTNLNTHNYVAYCFSEVAGYSKFGSYTGNGSSDGTFVFTGFRPAWIMTKRTDSSGDWYIYDNKRPEFNVNNILISPHNDRAEISYTSLDILSNGFKLRNTGTDINASGGTIIYLAFAESPFKNARAR